MKRGYTRERDDIQTSETIFNSRNGSIKVENGGEIFLEPRLKGFLTLLLENANNVVTRDELMDFVWKDLVVSDESVTKAASDLRKFFATHNITSFKLTTISKLGYKLEIIEPDQKKKSFSKMLLKLIGYLLLILLLTIILIRAINY